MNGYLWSEETYHWLHRLDCIVLSAGCISGWIISYWLDHIVSYILFILSCTTLEVRICVNSICIILLLRHKYSASLRYRRNWCQQPLPISLRLPRANGSAPVPVLMVALLFRRVLTLVRPTPVPPTPHPVHLSHPGSNQPAHKSQCSDPANTIQYYPIQPI